MSGSRAAIRYAKAILSFALEQQKEVQVNEDMMLIATTIEESDELQVLLTSPVIKTELKKAALNQLFASKVSSLTIGLINLLIDNKRLAILSYVAKKYTVLFDKLKGIEVAKVTSAFPLTDALNKKVLSKVKELTGKEATIENVINPEIIGGFILRIGDVQYDASVANKLQGLKRQFESESYRKL
ncbi:MAG: ATP synthase F1 subunit delta [Lutibacter sp.]|uniref:ATP synthase F1 subunit delta n=1 Tax=Lutibacter sp. TaxID=1925666 RepID=UPI0018446F90|nr:ATP synthase F1 subunit delta [Lutibacter sp.]MBT8317669.1 ATP synthase F1 subunit delta [Lutibacter sp.]NNJ58527.1 ATP synthase F1 subunit delta [Lutibacter sp.]